MTRPCERCATDSAGDATLSSAELVVLDEFSDEELAALAQRRDGARAYAAYEALVRRLEGPLYGFLMVRVGNAAEAEEIVQDAFLRGWLKLDKYDPRWRFTTWIYTVAKRLAVSRARVRRPEALCEEASAQLTDGHDPVAEADVRDDAANVWSVAARVLSPEQRSALWLRYAEERTNEEIAEILGRKRVTVRVLLHRAREALATALGADRGRGRAASGTTVETARAADATRLVAVAPAAPGGTR